MERYRVRRASLDAQTSPSRAAMLQAIQIEEHETHAVAAIAGEPLFIVATLAALLESMSLSLDDLEAETSSA